MVRIFFRNSDKLCHFASERFFLCILICFCVLYCTNATLYIYGLCLLLSQCFCCPSEKDILLSVRVFFVIWFCFLVDPHTHVGFIWHQITRKRSEKCLERLTRLINICFVQLFFSTPVYICHFVQKLFEKQKQQSTQPNDKTPFCEFLQISS